MALLRSLGTAPGGLWLALRVAPSEGGDKPPHSQKAPSRGDPASGRTRPVPGKGEVHVLTRGRHPACFQAENRCFQLFFQKFEKGLGNCPGKGGIVDVQVFLDHRDTGRQVRFKGFDEGPVCFGKVKRLTGGINGRKSS